MTVKILTEEQKATAIRAFVWGVSINVLMGRYNCSRRTMVRVIEQSGVDPGIKRRKRLPKPEPLPTVIPTKTPWWKKIIPWVSTVSQRRFQA